MALQQLQTAPRVEFLSGLQAQLMLQPQVNLLSPEFPE